MEITMSAAAAGVSERQRWMGILARATTADLERAWRSLPDKPAYEFLRRPEVGLVVLRARTGGTGSQFNLGEASVARCVVRTESKIVGCGYVMGRDERHAELAALFDAMLQDEQSGDRLKQFVVAPLEAAQLQERQASARKSADTRVNFFTMVRGMS
jgi:alpha-D-ribose 1-methylphosphonate 5-triphosphate synthase subunit PhnG